MKGVSGQPARQKLYGLGTYSGFECVSWVAKPVTLARLAVISSVTISVP